MGKDIGRPSFYVELNPAKPSMARQYRLEKLEEDIYDVVVHDPAHVSSKNPSGIVPLESNRSIVLLGVEPVKKTFAVQGGGFTSVLEVKIAEVITNEADWPDVVETNVRFKVDFEKSELKKGFFITYSLLENTVVELMDKYGFTGNIPTELSDYIDAGQSDLLKRGVKGDLHRYFEQMDITFPPKHENGAKLAQRAYLHDQAGLTGDESPMLSADGTIAPSTAMTVMPPKSRLSKAEEKVLAAWCDDLNQKAIEGTIDRAVQRDEEVQHTIQTLGRRKKGNPVLIGEAGVGKTAIAYELAHLITSQDAPAMLEGKRLFKLDLNRMVAGTKYRGEFEQRLQAVIDAAKNENVILFIDELHTLIGAGSAEGSLDASNALKPALADGLIRIIGATTLKEYRKYIEKDDALSRRFQAVQINPSDEETTAFILESDWNNNIKNFYKFEEEIDPALFAYTVSLAEKYDLPNFDPDRSLSVLDEASSRARYDVLEQKKKGAERVNTVTKDDIQKTVAKLANVPLSHIQTDDSSKYLRLEENLNKDVFGQEKALKMIADRLLAKQAGLGDPERPTAFLLPGPTGTGKTETAKSLAKNLYGKTDDMIRIDMSELKEEHSVAKLIGSPPGYVGYNDAGALEKVRTNKHTVLLLDEIEKAHPKVLDILLQILDNGKATMSNGVEVPFKNTTIVMTTNLGAADMNKILEGGKSIGVQIESSDAEKSTELRQKLTDAVNRAVSNSFRPETLARIQARGGIAIYYPIDLELEAEKEEQPQTLKTMFEKAASEKKSANVLRIVNKHLDEVKARFSSNAGAGFTDVQLVFNDDIAQCIAVNGYDRKNGGRSIEPFISQYLITPLSRWIMQNKKSIESAAQEGPTVVLVNELGDAMQPILKTAENSNKPQLLLPAPVEKKKRVAKKTSGQ